MFQNIGQGLLRSTNLLRNTASCSVICRNCLVVRTSSYYCHIRAPKLYSTNHNLHNTSVQIQKYSSVTYPVTSEDHIQHSRPHPIHKEGSLLTTKRIVRRKKTKDGQPPKDQVKQCYYIKTLKIWFL